MTYKDIKSEIETYERKQNEAFLIYGDNEQEKKELYLRAKNKKDAALAALFDFCMVYRRGSTSEIEELKKGCMESIKNYEVKANNENIPSINDEFSYVYEKILYAALSLEKKEHLLLVKYGEEKRKQHLLRDKINRNKRDNKSVEEILSRVIYNYNKCMSDKKTREEDFFHVGTSKEYMQSYYDLITKEEVMYTIILAAIHDAIDSKKSNFVLSKELIENFYKNFKMQQEQRKRFFDEDAYILSRSGFSSYKNVFETVYDLSRKYEQRLVKKISNKIKEQ